MNKALEGARRKGREARIAGEPITACPYQDKRGGRHDHMITFSRAFIRAWTDGWRDGGEQKQSST